MNVRKFRRIRMVTRVEAFDSSYDSPFLRTRASSYWSVSEASRFPACGAHFGTDFSAIAKTMQTKTEQMVRVLFVLIF